MHEYEISYLKCQSCTAKIHCEQCAGELKERLLGMGGILRAELDIPARRLQISFSGMDEMDLLDMLEETGIFAG